MANEEKINLNPEKFWDNLIIELRERIPSDVDKMLQIVTKGLNTSKELNNQLYQGRFLTWEGAYFYYKGELTKGLESYLKSKLIIDKIGNPEDKANLYSNLGSLDNHFGQYESGIHWLEKSLEYYQEAGLKGGEVEVLLNLGGVANNMGDSELSLSYYYRALKKVDEKNLAHVSFIYDGLSNSYFLNDDFEQSLIYNSKSQEIKKQINDESGLITSIGTEGTIKFKQKKYEEALSLLTAAEQKALEIKDMRNFAKINYDLGVLYHETGNIEKALYYLDQTLELAKKNNNDFALIDTLRRLIDISIEINDFEAAFRYQKEKFEHFKKKNTEKNKLILKKIKLESDHELIEQESNSQKQLFAEKENSNRLFKARIKQINRQKDEITRQAELLQEANKSLRLFASTASHDIKEPLRMISSFGKLLKKYIEDPKGEEYLNFITTASENLNNLISALISYYRVGGEKLPFRKVDLNKVIEAVFFNLQLEIKETNAKLNYPELPMVDGHFTNFIQLFQHLISNAIKFRSSETNPEITISFETKGKAILFCFRDNGIGIPEERMEFIFEPFSRFHSKIENQGTGLGLATAKKIVTQYRGRIWAESAEGEGSSFYFMIPLKQEETTDLVEGQPG